MAGHVPGGPMRCWCAAIRSPTASAVAFPGPWTASRMTAVATVSAAAGPPGWVRPALVTIGGLTATAAVLAAVRLPVVDSTVWAESLAVAGSTVALVAVTCWLTGRADRQDQRLVLTWGLGSGVLL